MQYITWGIQLNLEIEYLWKVIVFYLCEKLGWKFLKKCDKYNQKNLDHDKQTAPGVLKTATTKAIQKTTGSTAGNLIGNKIEDAVV